MLLTGGADREHALHKATAGGTLGAVTAFAPKHRRTQRALGGVIGRLDPFRMQERPPRTPARHEIGAEAPQGIGEGLSRFDPFPHGLLDGLDHPLHRGAIPRAVAEHRPDDQHLLRQPQERGRLRMPWPNGLRPSPQVAHQMRPAELAALRIQAVIGAQPIRGDQPGEGGAEQGVQMGLAPTVLEQKERGDGGDRDPQPGFARPFPPTRLIDVGMRHQCHGLLHFGLRGGQAALATCWRWATLPTLMGNCHTIWSRATSSRSLIR